MKAVILVGGKATRLLPLTTNTPKALVPVLNRPFLEHMISHLGEHGVTEVILALGHLAGPIEKHLGDGSRLGVKLKYAFEDTPRGTAGGIKNVERFIDGPFLVFNGDIFTDLDITAMMAFHMSNRARATIATTPVEDPSAYGLIETKNDGRITRFVEKPAPDQITTNRINAGTYILEPDILAEIAPEKQVSIEREIFPAMLARADRVFAFGSDAYWIDMGTPAKYLQLHRDLLTGKSKRYTPPPGLVLGDKTSVAPSAIIEGPVILGNHCSVGENAHLTGPLVIGDSCKIGAGSRITDSVLWHGVHTGQDAIIAASIIADRCIVGDRVSCEGASVGDQAEIKAQCTVTSGARIESGTTVG